MYADRVDNWLEENSYSDKHPEESVTAIGLLIVPMFKMMGFSFKVCWIILCYTPPLCWIPPFSTSRKKKSAPEDEKKNFIYHPWIIGRKTKSEFFKCSLTDDVNQKRIATILDEAATELREDEQVLFLIKDEDNIGKDTGMIFTETRLIYNLEKQGKLKMSNKGGEVKLTELGVPNISKTMSDSLYVNFGELKIGCLKFFKSVDLVKDFLVELRKAVQASA